MTDKEQIMINGVDVSKCKHHRKYILPDNIGCKIDDFLCCDNPNCYFKQLAHSEARAKELEEKLNAQFAEMEEKLTAEEMKNYELKEKLRIALSSLNDIATIDNYIVAQVDAQQALQKISEVEE